MQAQMLKAFTSSVMMYSAMSDATISAALALFQNFISKGFQFILRSSHRIFCCFADHYVTAAIKYNGVFVGFKLFIDTPTFL